MDGKIKNEKRDSSSRIVEQILLQIFCKFQYIFLNFNKVIYINISTVFLFYYN